MKEAEQKYNVRHSEKHIKRKKRNYYIIFGIVGLITFPLIASIATREKIVRDEEVKIMKALEELKQKED